MGGSCCNHDHDHDNVNVNKNQNVLVHHVFFKRRDFLPFSICYFFSCHGNGCHKLYIISQGCGDMTEVAYRLFHNFHFLHLLFAAASTILMFRRYSSNFLMRLLVGFTVPAVFCTVSDAFLPYLGGKYVRA